MSVTPKESLKILSDDLLEHYAQADLIDKYDIYQHFMDYWEETMQDDCYIIASDGWKAETYRVLVKDKKGKEKDKGWACDLVPKSYIVNRYFSIEQDAIDKLNSELELNNSTLDELEEEHSGEEGILKDVGNKKEAIGAWKDALISLWQEEEATAYAKYNNALQKQEAETQRLTDLVEDPLLAPLANAKGAIVQKTLNAKLKSTTDSQTLTLLNSYKDATVRLKESKKTAKTLFDNREALILERLGKDDKDEALGELRVIKQYMDLLEVITELKSKIKTAEKELDDLAYNKYPTLTEEEIKTLVVDDKWLSAIGDSNQLRDRTHLTTTYPTHQRLAERYEMTLTQLDEQVGELEAKVNAHLEKMGFLWK